MSFNSHDYLEQISSLQDADIDLARAGIALAAIAQAGISTDRYFHHMAKLSAEVGVRYLELVEAGADEDAGTQLAALKHVIADKHGYMGDQETYDDLQNSNLIRVIDRARGIPISLSILYIHIARAQGWQVAGLDVPGHFICRLERDGERLLFDPFNDCKVLGAADLRFMIKAALGEEAELSSDYFEPASNRAILMRLQNNIKFRQIEGEDYKGALEVVQQMRKIDPNEYRLLLDAGVLFAKVDETKSAIDALEAYVERAPSNRDRQEALMILRQLQQKLN